MNNSDKTEIANLLSNIATMRETAKAAERVYNDPKIAAYCVAAIEDAKETKKYVMQTIAKNIGLFIDLGRLELRNGFYCNDINSVAAHRPIQIGIGDDMYIKVLFSESVAKMIPHGLYERVTVSCTPDDVELLDIHVRTSDTGRPEYSLCAWEDLYYKPQENWTFIPKGLWDAKNWSGIYAKAKRTRGLTKWLLDSFKANLSAKAKGLKARADESDAIREKNKDVETYVKVS